MRNYGKPLHVIAVPYPIGTLSVSFTWGIAAHCTSAKAAFNPLSTNINVRILQTHRLSNS